MSIYPTTVGSIGYLSSRRERYLRRRHTCFAFSTPETPLPPLVPQVLSRRTGSWYPLYIPSECPWQKPWSSSDFQQLKAIIKVLSTYLMRILALIHISPLTSKVEIHHYQSHNCTNLWNLSEADRVRLDESLGRAVQLRIKPILALTRFPS